MPVARPISAAHCASRLAAACAQVTMPVSTGVAPVAPAAPRVANSTRRAGEAPADGEPPLVASAHRSVVSLRSSAEMCPSSRA